MKFSRQLFKEAFKQGYKFAKINENIEQKQSKELDKLINKFIEMIDAGYYSFYSPKLQFIKGSIFQCHLKLSKDKKKIKIDYFVEDNNTSKTKIVNIDDIVGGKDFQHYIIIQFSDNSLIDISSRPW